MGTTTQDAPGVLSYLYWFASGAIMGLSLAMVWWNPIPFVLGLGMAVVGLSVRPLRNRAAFLGLGALALAPLTATAYVVEANRSVCYGEGCSADISTAPFLLTAAALVVLAVIGFLAVRARSSRLARASHPELIAA